MAVLKRRTSEAIEIGTKESEPESRGRLRER